jgi:hypothetical protein
MPITIFGVESAPLPTLLRMDSVIDAGVVELES